MQSELALHCKVLDGRHDDEAGARHGSHGIGRRRSHVRSEGRSDPAQPFLLAARGVGVFVAYGVVWWSVRGQHPYEGPTAWALLVLYAIVVGVIVSAAIVFRRATAGVGGRSRVHRRGEIVAYVAAWTAPYVFQSALLHAGASHAIVYGIAPATLPLIIVGAAAGATCATRENWPGLGLAVGVVAVASGAAFAGPAAVWLVVGVGLGLAVVGYAGVQAAALRRA
jgi:hypothetical protein